MTNKLGYLFIPLAFVACKKKDDAATKAADDKPAAPAAKIDAAGVNALVPAALKDKLVFEQRDIVLDGMDKATYTLAAPKDWKQTSKMFGTLEGPGFSKMTFGPDCGGECKPKDWAKVFDDGNGKNLTTGDHKVIKDEKRPNGRTIISEDTGGMHNTIVKVATWTDGASEYQLCGAELSEDMKDAAPAFEKACSAVNVVKTGK
jgi:hypothetical protein